MDKAANPYVLLETMAQTKETHPGTYQAWSSDEGGH